MLFGKDIMWVTNIQVQHMGIDGRYEGQVKNGKPHGTGRLVSEDGSVYEGQFENGSRSGYGRQIQSGGNHIIGHYKDGWRATPSREFDFYDNQLNKWS